MEQDIRWQQRFSNFEKALLFLQAGCLQKKWSQLEEAGLVQAFEFTFELAWKTLKDYLHQKGVKSNFPRDVIIQVLKKFPEIKEAILFGSRAMGREKKSSDIDLALKGNGLEEIAAQVAYELNSESPLPYYFDILDYLTIENPELRGHIDRVGKVIFLNVN